MRLSALLITHASANIRISSPDAGEARKHDAQHQHHGMGLASFKASAVDCWTCMASQAQISKQQQEADQFGTSLSEFFRHAEGSKVKARELNGKLKAHELVDSN